MYNASVIFWKYARAFSKRNYKRHLCASLKKITSSLKEIDDPDYEWRAFLCRTLVEAHIDDHRAGDASLLAKETLQLMREHLPNMFDEFYEYMVRLKDSHIFLFN